MENAMRFKTFYVFFLMIAALGNIYGMNYSNEELDFSIDIPSGWTINLQDQWPEEFKGDLQKHFIRQPLFILKPSDVDISDSCIMVFGKKIDSKRPGIAKALFDQNAEKTMTSDTDAKRILGEEINNYRKIDTYYYHEPTTNLYTANVIYEHENEKNTTFITVEATFLKSQKRITLQGYSKSINPEEYWTNFQNVVDSVQFGIKDFAAEQLTFDGIWKWAGIVLTVLIVLGILKMLFFRD